MREHRFSYLNDIFDNVMKKMQILRERLNKIGKDEKIVIWPVGEHTRYLCSIFDFTSYNIVFVDKFAHEICGNSVIHPDEIKWSEIKGVIVSTFMLREEIENELKNYGFDGEIISIYDENDECEFYKYDYNRFLKKERKENYIYNTESFSLLKDDMDNYCRMISGKTNYYVNYSLFEKYPEKSILPVSTDYSEQCIIIQGPIVNDDDFTLHTACFYKTLFPNAIVIISTWQGEESKIDIVKLHNEGINIVFNKIPENKGDLNINLQLVSTTSGIKNAKKLGAKYVLKTRSDIRFYAADLLLRLKNKLECEKTQIVCTPVGENLEYYYLDYYNYGRIDDMLLFWDADNAYKYSMLEGYAVEQFLYRRYVDYQLKAQKKDYYIDTAKVYSFYPYESLKMLWNKYDYSKKDGFCSFIYGKNYKVEYPVYMDLHRGGMKND